MEAPQLPARSAGLAREAVGGGSSTGPAPAPQPGGVRRAKTLSEGVCVGLLELERVETLQTRGGENSGTGAPGTQLGLDKEWKSLGDSGSQRTSQTRPRCRQACKAGAHEAWETS